MPQLKTSPNFSFEKKIWRRGFKYACGVDEAGRGAWAGPIVAAACAFAPKFQIVEGLGIDDSKRLKPKKRERLAAEIKKYALVWSVAEIPVRVINKLGIGKATAAAMRKALKKLRRSKIFVLVDGFHVKYLTGGLKNQKAITHGDQKSISIAAASILAKVHRDKIMRRLGRNPRYKVYGWGRNKGYGTKLQQKAILRYGLTRFHRKAFVKTWLAKKRS